MSPARILALLSLAAAVATVATMAMIPATAAQTARPDYVGTETCASCHAEAYAIWQNTAHARADLSLGQTPSRRCLACHTTGEVPAGRPFSAGVTCEACHGPGAGYAADDIMRDPTLARALGLRDLSTPELRKALCAECHRAGTRLAPFEAERAFGLIAHPRSRPSAQSAQSPQSPQSPETAP